MNFNRLKHSYAVAKKMQEIGEKNDLSKEELESLFLLGFVHDIGYEFTENGVSHNKIGGKILKEQGFSYWKEVYYHGELPNEYTSLYLDILNMADMMINGVGEDVGYLQRLEDIATRYGKDSVVYQKCNSLVNYLENLSLKI